MEYISLIVKKWETYNPRADIKRPTWFRFEHAFFDSSQFYGWNPVERIIWIYILCEAAKQTRSDQKVVRINVSHATAVTTAKTKDVHRTLQKLKELHIIEIRTAGGRYGSARENHATNERTNETVRDERDERDETNELNLAIRSADALPVAGDEISDEKPITRETWAAYSIAYESRHGSAPKRNATVNKQMLNFVKRIGADEAPHVASFFLSHNDSFYVRSMHPVGLLLKDAEKLRTEWITGRKMTGQTARAAEKESTMNDQLLRISRGEL